MLCISLQALQQTSIREGRSLKTFKFYCCLCVLGSYCNDFSCGATVSKILCFKAREPGMKTVLQGKQYLKLLFEKTSVGT